MLTGKKNGQSDKGRKSQLEIGLFASLLWFHLGVSGLPLSLTSVLAPQIRASLSCRSVLPEFLGHREDQSSKKDCSHVGILFLNKSQHAI